MKVLSTFAPFMSAILFSSLIITQVPAHVSAQDINRDAFPVPADNDVITSFGVDTKNQLPPKKLRFLVWNLYKGAEDSFRSEYISLAFNRDIVVHQEVYLDDKMRSTFAFLPYFKHNVATSFFSGKEMIRTGVGTASPVAPSSVAYVRTQTLEPVVKSPKVTLITRYPIRFSTKQLTIVNIHSINFVSNKAFKLELERIYQAIKDIPAPLVFTGDFNTWNEERHEILKDYSKKLGLTAASFYPDNRMTFNGYPLDHFLHTKDMIVTKAMVDGFYRGSDHKPLEVEVELL